eukprot:12392-Heterococcus_DN1.PRE.3
MLALLIAAVAGVAANLSALIVYVALTSTAVRLSHLRHTLLSCNAHHIAYIRLSSLVSMTILLPFSGSHGAS